jgi:membrane-bound metal-dependent hydrolase YbcI (DUF457 family)
MMGRSHMATGAAAVLLVEPHQPWPMLVATAALGAAAALLPDLDIGSSTVSRSLGPVTRLLSRVIAWAAGGHRCGTHSLLALALAAYATVAAGLPSPYARALVYGYAAHLLGDLLTGNGIPLLWPLVRHRQGLPIFGHTGGWREHAVVGAVVVGAVYAAVAT